LLGQFASFAEGNITIPTTYGNIGRIEIEANSAAQAIISSVTFQHSNVNNTAVAIAPEEIQYTLTDSDGDTSSATLRLTVESNHYAGTSSGDTLTGSNANDYMSGLDGDDNISGGAGADVISGGAGNDTLDGGADNDQIFGGAGNDTIIGGTGNDLLYGEAGNDNIQGGDGNDLLSGGVGSDTLNGGAGADTIIGGAGADVLTGGLGVDVFKWELGDQGAKGTPTNDIITDFNVAPSGSGGDVLDLRDLLTGEAHIGNNPGNLASYLHFEKLGADTIVHVSANGEFAAGFNPAKDVQTITLSGVDLVTGFGNDQQVIQDLLTNNKLIVD
jgi:Ca2+-binding RTX toxin-like protein